MKFRQIIFAVPAKKLTILSAAWLVCFLACFNFSLAQSPEKPRLALIEFSGELRHEISAFPPEAANTFRVTDPDLVRTAVSGSGWNGSLNLTRDEARWLGLTIGCDFYLTGAARLFQRIITDNQFYVEAIAGIFVVETRTGKLQHFAFIRLRADDEATARRQLRQQFQQHWQTISPLLIEIAQKNGESAQPPDTSSLEIIDGESPATNISQPVFFQRLKPDYTEQAAALSVTATVDLQVVFQADGQAGEIEVTRWAGFGLEEAAVATVRQLRFKPAERDGKSLSFRALVRYNFRRPPDAAQKRHDAEQLKRSLRRPPLQVKPQTP
jgi:TonB family protein